MFSRVTAYIGEWDLANLRETDPAESYDCSHTDCKRQSLRRDVVKVIAHENYTVRTLGPQLTLPVNDIVLLLLKEPITSFNS